MGQFLDGAVSLHISRSGMGFHTLDVKGSENYSSSFAYYAVSLIGLYRTFKYKGTFGSFGFFLKYFPACD